MASWFSAWAAALAPGSPPPFHSLSLVSAGLIVSHFLTPLSQGLFIYVTTETLPSSLIGPGLASIGSVLELAGTASVQHGGNCWCLCTEAPLKSPLLPKP